MKSETAFPKRPINSCSLSKRLNAKRGTVETDTATTLRSEVSSLRRRLGGAPNAPKFQRAHRDSLSDLFFKRTKMYDNQRKGKSLIDPAKL